MLQNNIRLLVIHWKGGGGGGGSRKNSHMHLFFYHIMLSGLWTYPLSYVLVASTFYVTNFNKHIWQR